MINPNLPIPVAPLARSRKHHVAMGSSAGSKDPQHYDTPEAELMSDEELHARVTHELDLVRQVHARLISDSRDDRLIQTFIMMRDHFLMPNLYYLRDIDRLPEGFDIEAIKEELQTPE